MVEEWSKFLTAQDQSLLSKSGWAKQTDFGFGSRPALVIVDAYYGALGLPRKPMMQIIDDWPGACGATGWDAIDATAVLLDAARTKGVPVVFLTGLAANPNPWNRKPKRTANVTSPPSLQIVDELKPREDEIVLEKTSPSGFSSTGIDALLREQLCDTILLCGEATSGCVRATAVDGCVAGYAMGVVSDCCFDRFESSHWMSLFDINQKYGDVIDSSSALAYISNYPG